MDCGRSAACAVACGWVVYASATAPNPNPEHWPIVSITAPASLLGRIMALADYWFILLNAVIYTGLGLAIELIRDHGITVFNHLPY